jgi:hypothetical protein
LPIFCEKIGVFLKNQCYDQIFSKTSSSLSKKPPIYSQKYSAKILKNIASVLGHPGCQVPQNKMKWSTIVNASFQDSDVTPDFSNPARMAEKHRPLAPGLYRQLFRAILGIFTYIFSSCIGCFCQGVYPCLIRMLATAFIKSYHQYGQRSVFYKSSFYLGMKFCGREEIFIPRLIMYTTQGKQISLDLRSVSHKVSTRL